MRWLSNLKMWQKFMLLGVIALIMMVPPFLYLLKAETERASLARSEYEGLKPAADLLRAIQAMQVHRALSNLTLGGNEAKSSERSSKETEATAALEAVLASSAIYKDAEIESLRSGINTQWRALAQDVAAKSISVPESIARHTHLIGEQLILLNNFVNTSKMALDPTAETYYLIQATLNYMPLVTELMGQLRGRGGPMLARKEVKPEEKDILRILLSQANANFRRTRDAVALSVAENAAFAAELKRPLQEAEAAMQEMNRLVQDELIKPQSVTMTPAAYVEATTRVIDVQFALMNGSFKLLSNELASHEKDASRTSAAAVVVFIGLLAFGLWMGTVVARLVASTAREALAAAQALERGDLSYTVKTDSHDEIGQMAQALGRAMSHLARMISDIRSTSESVSTASGQIASGNQDLSSRTEEQASSLQQTAASMEQLTSTVKQSADNAKQANQLASAASEAATKGGAVVGQVVSTMEDITASSKKIADIISVIDGIAFQTNILALNAAVEAARAGEQGRGFAVVAGEVRNLAQRSAQAAREIKSLISDSVEKVDNGSKQVAEAGAAMSDIVLQVKRVTDLIGEITTASLEQSSGIGQVNDAITQMDQVTQQNAALVEQSAAAAASLKEQAESLAQAVSVFKLSHQHSQQAISNAQTSAKQATAAAAPAKVGGVRGALKRAVAPKAAKSTAASESSGSAKDNWEEF